MDDVRSENENNKISQKPLGGVKCAPRRKVLHLLITTRVQRPPDLARLPR